MILPPEARSAIPSREDFKGNAEQAIVAKALKCRQASQAEAQQRHTWLNSTGDRPPVVETLLRLD